MGVGGGVVNNLKYYQTRHGSILKQATVEGRKKREFFISVSIESYCHVMF